MGACASGVGLAVNFVIAPLLGRFSGWNEDFAGALAAGAVANRGGDIYAAFVGPAPNHLVTQLGFDYPPLTVLVFRPLAAMPHQVAVVLWLWLLLAATVAACLVVATTVLPERWPRFQIGLVTAGLFVPCTYSLWHGQVNPVILLSLALALRSWLRGDELRCGLYIGLGAAVKLSPIVLVLLLLRRGWWRGAAVSGAVAIGSLLAGGAFVGMATLREWVTGVVPVLSRDDGYFFNDSWNAVVNRVADHNVVRVDAPLAVLHPLVLGLGAATLLTAAWVVRPGGASRERRSLEFAGGVVALLLAGTITWYAHYVHLVIPLLVAVAVIGSRGWRNARALTVTLGAVLVVEAAAMPLFLGIGAQPATAWATGTLFWWPYLQLLSLPALVLVPFLGALIVAARRSPEAVPASLRGGIAPARTAAALPGG